MHRTTTPGRRAVVLRAQPDERLAALTAAGSDAAFEVLVERHQGELLAHARRIAPSGGIAEDVLQQALVSAWRALVRGDQVEDVRAWLHRITHNHALNAVQRQGPRVDVLDDRMTSGAAPHDAAELRTTLRRTFAELSALPPIQRDALLRTAVHGESYADVADDFHVTEGTIRGIVFRTRAALRAGIAMVTPSPLIAWAAGSAPSGAETVVVPGTAAGIGAASVLVKVAAGAAVIAGGVGGGAVLHATVTPHARAHVADVSSRSPQARVSVPSRIRAAPRPTTHVLAVRTPIARTEPPAVPVGTSRRRGHGSVSSTQSTARPPAPEEARDRHEDRHPVSSSGDDSEHATTVAPPDDATASLDDGGGRTPQTDQAVSPGTGSSGSADDDMAAPAVAVPPTDTSSPAADGSGSSGRRGRHEDDDADVTDP